MYIIISPAKIFKEIESNQYKAYKPLPFYTKTSELIKILQGYDAEALKSLMKVSDALTTINLERYRGFEEEDRVGYEAVYYFYGEVYKALEVDCLEVEALTYLNQHLGILSGLYGVLAPQDVIQPYRLEMGTKLEVNGKSGLYNFWKKDLTAYVLQRLDKEQQEACLINLASDEYSKALDLKCIKTHYPVIQISFKEQIGEQYKVVGMYAKKARGLMLRYMSMKQLRISEEIKAFNEEGYTFNEVLSTKEHFVFTRKRNN